MCFLFFRPQLISVPEMVTWHFRFVTLLPIATRGSDLEGSGLATSPDRSRKRRSTSLVRTPVPARDPRYFRVPECTHIAPACSPLLPTLYNVP